MKDLKCPHCNEECHVQSAEREGEGESADGSLIPTHCFEAWVECPSHGWVSEGMNIECWSEEVPFDEPLTESHRLKAEQGARDSMAMQQV